jgi:AcrR family transcriptional regulator
MARKTPIPPRTPLNKRRVAEVAVALADEVGFEGLSMRALADRLGVAPMAAYKHFANKDEMLAGMVDLIFEEIDLPDIGGDWKVEMRKRAQSTRAALQRHPWAIGLMEGRAPRPANLRNHDAVMGCLREAGFEFQQAIHAYSVQDAYIYGFALQERGLNLETPESAGKAINRQAEEVGGLEDYPYLAEIAARLPDTGYDVDVEFLWGLDLILTALERLVERGRPISPR